LSQSVTESWHLLALSKKTSWVYDFCAVCKDAAAIKAEYR
jgi:hypothetical protein